MIIGQMSDIIIQMPILTEKQKAVFEGLKTFIQEKGYPPSLRELAKKVGLHSPDTVDYHLSKLEEKGLLRCEKNRFRAIAIISEPAKPQNAIVGPILETATATKSNFPIEKYKEVTMDRKSSIDEKLLRDKIIAVLRSNRIPLELALKLLSQCQSQIRNILIIERILKECGLRPSRFLTNEHLELYYDIKRGRHDVGYISKGWDDPGFRIGDIVEIKKESIEAFKQSTYELLRFCATNGITFTMEKAKYGLELQMEGVIYSDGFNKRVFQHTLEALNECLEKALELMKKYS